MRTAGNKLQVPYVTKMSKEEVLGFINSWSHYAELKEDLDPVKNPRNTLQKFNSPRDLVSMVSEVSGSSHWCITDRINLQGRQCKTSLYKTAVYYVS